MQFFCRFVLFCDLFVNFDSPAVPGMAHHFSKFCSFQKKQGTKIELIRKGTNNIHTTENVPDDLLISFLFLLKYEIFQNNISL